MTKKTRRKEGRPTKYLPKYCFELIKFFSIEPYREKEISHTNSKGEVWTEYKEVANDPPFFSAFARKIKVNTDTLIEWCSVHREFSEAYKAAKELQLEFFVTNGSKGLYAQPMTIFTLKNIQGWRDVQNIEHSGDLTFSQVVKNAYADYKRQSVVAGQN